MSPARIGRAITETATSLRIREDGDKWVLEASATTVVADGLEMAAAYALAERHARGRDDETIDLATLGLLRRAHDDLPAHSEECDCYQCCARARVRQAIKALEAR